MKAQLLKISNKVEQSFSIRHDEVPVFHNKWHYHPEIEIIHIRKGKGTFIIGDCVAPFEENDLFILGTDLPHLFRYDAHGEGILSDAYVIHFLPGFFSERFLRVPEMKDVNEFISRSQRGIQIRSDAPESISRLMEQLHRSEGIQRIILLFSILAELTEIETESQLASVGFSHTYDAIDSERLNSIYQYVLSNFQREITLAGISSVANLSVHSFCRYFKTKTNKTFSNFLLEVRVGHACRLIIETDLNISQVCFECGFNNLSNFNRYFKKFVGKTPTQYSRDYKD
ncbi:AraC family transcriptional regulator [Persicitalea jodogahamensis]|uniref:AraC family transcriptional regulator n=1 Tax=Persicitalea jodogahamensis TaxID=402147 RepID=A0A8J3D7A2_9BACT|nr:AraC family transcriptional regulator [Persicitalea jodogahamensis]GHB63601.1 AraC family transcriptional regulator [Persicitalea jodogahamensis]